MNETHPWTESSLAEKLADEKEKDSGQMLIRHMYRHLKTSSIP